MCSFSFLEKCSRLLLAQQAQPGCCCWLCPLYSRCPALAPWRYKLWVFGAIPAAGSAMFWSSGCSGACWVSTCHLVLLSLPSCCQCSLLWPCAHSSAVLCALITGSDATVKNLPPPAPSHPSRARNPLFKLFAVLWVSNYSDCSVYPCLQPVSVWSLGRRSPAGWLCTAQLRLLLLPTQRLWVPVKCFMNLFPKTPQVKTRARTLALHKAFC